MTEIKMKRIGLRLVVISVISLVVFLSIRKQYNTAQSMLQQNVVMSPASLKDGAVEQAEESADDSAANERSGRLVVDTFQRTGWTKNGLSESLVQFRIDLVNDGNSKNNGGDDGQEEEAAFYETEKDRENLDDSTVDLQQPKGTFGLSEDDFTKSYSDLVRSESENGDDLRTQTETLPEDSRLEMVVEVDTTDEDDAGDNAGDGEDVTPNVVQEIYITPLPNNDATETDGYAQNAEEEVDDIIDEYDKYTDEPTQRQLTEDFTPTEVTISTLQGINDRPKFSDLAHTRESLAIFSPNLKDQAKDLNNVVQMSFAAPDDPGLPRAGSTPSLSADARFLQETLTQGFLTSILGDQLSPRMVRYLRYKILASLQKSRNEDIADSPKGVNSLQDQLSTTAGVDIMKNGVADQPMVNYEIRQVKANDLAANDVKDAEDKIVFLNEPDQSTYSDQKIMSSYTTTTPHVHGYDNPRPLSEADYTLLRTKANMQPHINSQSTLSSTTAGGMSTRNPLDVGIPRPQSDQQNTSNRIVFSSKFLTTPSWMKPVPRDDQTFTNERSFPEEKTLNRQKEALQQIQLSDLFQNAIKESANKINVGHYQTNLSDQHEQEKDNLSDQKDSRSLQEPTEKHLLNRQLKSQGELQLLQEHNDPGQPGHSYQDILLQQRVQIDQPVLGISGKDSLTPLEVKDQRRYPLGRVESCPREVKLGDKPHAITALVSFPGEDTMWMRQILEQLFGETTDSLYDITADLQAGNVSRVYDMSKHVAIQTHSALDRNFERALVLVRNPYSVEERHKIFRPDYIDWQKQYLWGDTYSSWLSSDLPLYVIVYEDMVESPLTELIKLADFLRNDDYKVSYQCALKVAEKPPKMVSDLREITGIYFKERININENIDKILQVANSKFPELIPRLESYKV